jgi:hypothetical protein
MTALAAFRTLQTKIIMLENITGFQENEQFLNITGTELQNIKTL